MVTGTKTSQRRHKLRLEMIDIAQGLMRERGLSAITARAVTGKAGCSLGTIYNVFDDIDDLIVAVNSRTLAQLDSQINDYVSASHKDNATDKEILSGLAVVYARFAMDNENAWSALFEHGERINRSIPDWHMDEHVKLISHIARPLRQLRPDDSEDDLWQLAGLMFSAVHGVVSLGLQGFFFATPHDRLEAQVKSLVDAMLTGFDAG